MGCSTNLTSQIFLYKHTPVPLSNLTFELKSSCKTYGIPLNNLLLKIPLPKAYLLISNITFSPSNKDLTFLVHRYTTFCIFTFLSKKLYQRPYPTLAKASRSSLILNMHFSATINNTHKPLKHKHTRKGTRDNSNYNFLLFY